MRGAQYPLYDPGVQEAEDIALLDYFERRGVVVFFYYIRNI